MEGGTREDKQGMLCVTNRKFAVQAQQASEAVKGRQRSSGNTSSKKFKLCLEHTMLQHTYFFHTFPIFPSVSYWLRLCPAHDHN